MRKKIEKFLYLEHSSIQIGFLQKGRYNNSVSNVEVPPLKNNYFSAKKCSKMKPTIQQNV